MIRTLVEAFETFREKRSRAKKAIAPRRRMRLEVEPLEDRWLLSTLLWVAQNPGAWNNDTGNWADMADGSFKKPANGDTLKFDPNSSTQGTVRNGTNTASTNDMANLALAGFTMANGYTSTITVNNDFATTGTVTVADGTLDGAANRTLTASGSFNWSGGTIAISVDLGTATNSPSLSISGTGPKIFKGGFFTSYASTTWTGVGSFSIRDGASFRNEAGAIFDIQTDADIVKPPDSTGSFVNSGTFKKTQGGGQTSIAVSFTNTNANGLVSFQSGTVAFLGNWSQTNGHTELNGGNCITNNAFDFRGGKLTGVGTFTGDVASRGEVIPGVGGSGQFEHRGRLHDDRSQQAHHQHQCQRQLRRPERPGLGHVGRDAAHDRDTNYKPAESTELKFLLYNSASGSLTADIPNNDWRPQNGVDHLFFEDVQESQWYELFVRKLEPSPGEEVAAIFPHSPVSVGPDPTAILADAFVW